MGGDAAAESMPDRTKMHIMLLSAQLAFAIFEVLTRYVLVEGINQYIFAVYRNAIASVILGSAAYFLERSRRPSLTWRIAGHMFLLGFVGVFCNQLLYYTGLSYTSATFTSAMQNSTPAYTFILATIFRLEKVRIKRRDGQAKLLGTIIGVSGAILMIVFNGPIIYQGQSGVHDYHHLTNYLASLTTIGTYQIGCLSLVFTCLSFAIYLILQTPLYKIYPAPLTVAAGAAFFGAVDLTILAVVTDRKSSSWIFTDRLQIISVLYAGVIASSYVAGIQSWGVRIRRGGPVIVSAYQPLETLIVAALSILILHETLYLGSLLGGILVICGLYLVIWGQGEDKKFTIMKRRINQPLLSDASDTDDHLSQANA